MHKPETFIENRILCDFDIQMNQPIPARIRKKKKKLVI